MDEENIMKEKEICFIMCSNNAMYRDEALFYIHHLHIPEGYTIDVRVVEDASSITSGYNRAMRESGAKYKVYLHQDTFLINKDMLGEALDIFQKDKQIGMLGVIGTPKMPSSGVMWEADRYGLLYDRHVRETWLFNIPVEAEFMEMEAIDGLFMMTQYDVPWREDLFCRWDFYDASQSMEFIRHGYKVVVPRMKKVWCVHDCGFLNLKNYKKEQRKYVKEYLGEK